MTDVAMISAVISAMIFSIAIAGILAYNKIQGWGWFLFIAFIIATGIKVH